MTATAMAAAAAMAAPQSQAREYPAAAGSVTLPACTSLLVSSAVVTALSTAPLMPEPALARPVAGPAAAAGTARVRRTNMAAIVAPCPAPKSATRSTTCPAECPNPASSPSATASQARPATAIRRPDICPASRPARKPATAIVSANGSMASPVSSTEAAAP
jgi:hypothetical protein